MATSAKARCALLDAVAEDQLFAPPVLSRTHRNDGKGNVVPVSYCHLKKTFVDRQSHKGGVTSPAVVETDTGMDASQAD